MRHNSIDYLPRYHYPPHKNAVNDTTTTNMARIQNRPSLERYPYKKEISTRWSDNDRYGHLNNALYYHFYDALINGYMMEHCNWHPDTSDAIGLVVSSGSEYFEIVDGFPQPLTLGLGIRKLGKSSVEYEIGVFQHDVLKAKAIGRFIHVFVDRKTDKTMPGGIPPELRAGLARLVIQEPSPKL
jgi:acyl-CoA thioester hydrolase